MPNDSWGRYVALVSSSGGIDTYSITDPNDSSYSFNLTFPTGTDETTVYGAINFYCPRGYINGSDQTTDLSGNGCFPSGRSNNRPTLEIDGIGAGMCFFDLDLGKPIWYVIQGTTGWVDSTGAQV